jgi:hypothetical protein
LKGRWDWNGPTNMVSNLIGISLRFNPPSTADQQLLTKLDESVPFPMRCFVDLLRSSTIDAI